MAGKVKQAQPLGNPMVDALSGIKKMLSKAAGKGLEEKKAKIMMIEVKDDEIEEDKKRKKDAEIAPPVQVSGSH